MPVTSKSSKNLDTPQAVAGALRIRLCARIYTLLIAGACAYFGGTMWKDGLIGALLGGLVVESNLSLIIRFLKKSNSWQKKSLAFTLIKFYLSFILTALICFLSVRNNWGDELSFLMGLLSFFFGLAFALVSTLLKPLKIIEADDE